MSLSEFIQESVRRLCLKQAVPEKTRKKKGGT